MNFSVQIKRNKMKQAKAEKTKRKNKKNVCTYNKKSKISN